MPRKELIEYAKEALAQQAVKLIRNRGNAAVNWRDLVENEVLSFIYDEYVHENKSWPKLMDEKTPSGKDSESETIVQKLSLIHI